MNLFKYLPIKVLTLILTTLTLIGHGIGCIDEIEDCGPVLYETTFSGSDNPLTYIDVGDSLDISATTNGVEYLNYSSATTDSGSTIQPITFHAPGYSPYRLKFNTPANGGNRIGELWVHQNGSSIKVVHASHSNSYADITTAKHNNLDKTNSSTIASSSAYMLSGSPDGTGYVIAEGTITIYINNISIFTWSEVTPDSFQPLVFNASTGDLLRISITQSNNDVFSMCPLWLHMPNGNGIKLIEYFEKASSEGTAELTFSLP